MNIRIFWWAVPVTIDLNSDLLQYLADRGCAQGERLPAITELADEIGISTGKLREQLEVARAMGLVEVRPKTGIRTLEYEFAPMLQANLLFALSLDASLFNQFGVLRNHVEAAFWYQAVEALLPEDKEKLSRLIDQAWQKLRGQPVQIPHEEHRELHMTVFGRLDNLFVQGLLEAYWTGYEAVGLNLFADYAYLQEVWSYHEKMVQAIIDEDYESGYQALVEHTGLIQHRPEMANFQPSVESLPQYPDQNEGVNSK